MIGPMPPADNEYVPVDIGFVNFLWVPDIYIYHLKTSKVLNIFTQFAGKTDDIQARTTPSIVFFFSSFSGLWIVNRTTILYSQETHVTFWCPMRFERYPLDHQVRSIKHPKATVDQASYAKFT